jgi:hypothetical protein
MRDEGSALRNE